MASRSKRKQMNGRVPQMMFETNLALASDKIRTFGTGVPEGGFSLERERRDASFRRSVEARNNIISLIEHNEALKKRMDEVWEDGRKVGFKQAGWPIIKSCMAGACLMLHEEFNMSDDDIIRGMKMLHDKIAWALEYSELADEVLHKTGIELRLDDPLDPVTDIR